MYVLTIECESSTGAPKWTVYTTQYFIIPILTIPDAITKSVQRQAIMASLTKVSSVAM